MIQYIAICSRILLLWDCLTSELERCEVELRGKTDDNSFMRSLNPYISQFDPLLHKFSYIQQKSSFLMSAILSASSKAFHPLLHPQLQAHTEKLLGKAFTKGEKSVEVVQAILVLTYWKEPDEARTWLLVGYAIRLCIELGWHKLQDRNPDEDRSEESVREHRNIQRTWLVLFVYDRRYDVPTSFNASLPNVDRTSVSVPKWGSHG